MTPMLKVAGSRCNERGVAVGLTTPFTLYQNTVIARDIEVISQETADQISQNLFGQNLDEVNAAQLPGSPLEILGE